MSELNNTREAGAGIRWQLLATVSALALMTSAADAARAAGDDHPTVWIELGGQMETMQSTSDPFVAPFMTRSPTPAPYEGDALIENQHAPRHSFGFEGKFVLQPQESDWSFSAGLLYGRSNANRHFHHQSPAAVGIYPSGVRDLYFAAYADVKSITSESHMVLDFAAGKDVGLGMFGNHGSSNINAGIRFAQFTSRSNASINGRPEVNVVPYQYYCCIRQVASFSDYQMTAHSARSFHGLGPSLSWDASATVLGNSESGELVFDWGVNAAVLFGRQKAKTDHGTEATYRPPVQLASYFNTQLYPLRPHADARSRSVVVPNIGGFAGVTVRKANAKLSLGYRADFFFGAVDAGIDARRTGDLSFHGPFARVSIGLGG